MQKNLYYRTVIRRSNLLKEAMFAFFLSLASYPRLFLEVFIRKNFGERYFRLSSVITITVLLAVVPLILHRFYAPVEAEEAVNPYFRHYVATRAPGLSFSWDHFITWYLYLAAFVYFGYLRFLEVKRNPSVFDFARYSLSSGKLNPIFFTISVPGRKTDGRLVETILEPAIFFIVGIFLMLIHQYLGIILVACSIIYCMSYIAAYRIGDNFVMDKIDEMICNQELKKSFVDGSPDEQTRGFRFVGRTPNDPEMRKQILPLLLEEDDTAVAL